MEQSINDRRAKALNLLLTLYSADDLAHLLTSGMPQYFASGLFSDQTTDDRVGEVQMFAQLLSFMHECKNQ